MTPSPTDFSELGVPPALCGALAAAGIETPFPIQAAVIPDAIAGHDVLGRAPTGSGKTLAFGIPLLSTLPAGRPRKPSGLILSPTRELAEQIRRELEPLAKAMDRRVAAVYGGAAMGPQLKALAARVDLLVACPGRLQDLIDRGEVSLAEVGHVVVDEADRMADMGFLPPVQALLDRTRSDRWTALFSATLDGEVRKLVDRYQREPIEHRAEGIEPEGPPPVHRFVSTERTNKLGVTADLIDDAGPTMVFCRTRHGVDRVARQLKRLGVKAGWIHGGRTQRQRDAALSAFSTGRVDALVATDVAARGIHVDGVRCVIHFDPPADEKDYVHRSGRTARAGAPGVVVSLVNPDQRAAVTKLQKRVGLAKAELEPTPALRERELPEWVDQRPDGGRTRSRQDRPTRSGGRRDRPDGERRDTTPRRPARRPAGDDTTTPRTDATPTPRTDDERREGGEGRPGRRRRSKKRTGAPTGGGGSASRKKRQTSKRSGRPRAKDHKQARRKAS